MPVINGFKSFVRRIENHPGDKHDDFIIFTRHWGFNDQHAYRRMLRSIANDEPFRAMDLNHGLNWSCCSYAFETRQNYSDLPIINSITGQTFSRFREYIRKEHSRVLRLGDYIHLSHLDHLMQLFLLSVVHAEETGYLNLPRPEVSEIEPEPMSIDDILGVDLDSDF